MVARTSMIFVFEPWVLSQRMAAFRLLDKQRELHLRENLTAADLFAALTISEHVMCGAKFAQR